MRIWRDTEGDTVNRIVSSPDADLRALVRSDAVWALVGEPPVGCAICIKVIDGVYEFHTNVLPEARGTWTVEFAESAIAYMFTRSDCVELLTRIPRGSVAATSLARRFSFQPRWSGSAAYKGQEQHFIVYSLTLMDWMPDPEEDFAIVINMMDAAGQQAKAMAWAARRKVLDRPVF